MAETRHILTYDLVDKLGEGPSGVVWRGWDRALERFVVVKILSEKRSADPLIQQFAIPTLTRLTYINHPNVAQVFDCQMVDDRLVIVTQEIPGQPITSLTVETPLSSDKLLELAAQICEGLRSVHERELVHGNLKPSNIIVDAAGKVRLTDFGLVISMDDSSLNRNGVTADAMRYQSPERVHNNAPTVESDLFSLGAVLYELATGLPAFPGEIETHVAQAIIYDEPNDERMREREVTPEIRLLILKALSKKPEERYTSTAELLFTIQGILDYNRSLQRPQNLHVRTASPRQYLMVSLLCILLLLWWVVITTPK
ncbi:MAG: serine/threonine-protein kinase [Candidatus Zixiibacteriota bacterium]|mgnify:CR=1 FL=1